MRNARSSEEPGMFVLQHLELQAPVGSLERVCSGFVDDPARRKPVLGCDFILVMGRVAFPSARVKVLGVPHDNVSFSNLVDDLDALGRRFFPGRHCFPSKVEHVHCYGNL
jgi:hypothetical protein